jgi:septal ring factor EnvC (AmiA/AmiB activator)
MVVEITLEAIGIGVAILGSLGAGASSVLIMFGNSKWATRKAVHDLANNTATTMAEMGKNLAASIDVLAKASASSVSEHSLRIQKLELEQSGIKSEIEGLKEETKEQTREIRAMERHLAEIVGHLSEITGDWKKWRKKNGPLNQDDSD